MGQEQNGISDPEGGNYSTFQAQPNSYSQGPRQDTNILPIDALNSLL